MTQEIETEGKKSGMEEEKFGKRHGRDKVKAGEKTKTRKSRSGWKHTHTLVLIGSIKAGKYA